MDFTDLLIELSVYKSIELEYNDNLIMEEYANIESNSIYQVLQELKKEYPHHKGIDYKNIYTRIQKLADYGLLEHLDKYFKHGAKHYKISDFGIISYIEYIGALSNIYDIIILHKQSILFKSILYQFFEEKTIDLVQPDSDDILSNLIIDYVYDCCHSIVVHSGLDRVYLVKEKKWVSLSYLQMKQLNNICHI